MRPAAGGCATANPEITGVPIKTPLVLLWSFGTLLWSLFTPPHRTFAARVLLFQPLWILRIWKQDSTWAQDLLLFELLHAVYSFYTGAWQLPSAAPSGWLDLNSISNQVFLQVITLLVTCGIFACAIVARGNRIVTDDRLGSLRTQRIDEQVLPPLILTSRTTHSRLIPRKHTFTYSYLFVGIPIGIGGRISKVLSVDSAIRGWFAVDSSDFLYRTDGPTTLAQKLNKFLKGEGVSDDDYAFAYLVTAPRFLGYSFNPVSFWYLYDSDTVLKYMILEVNNTFDERRMYLLKASSTMDKSDEDKAATGSSKQLIFTDQWAKDFHVSPFNSRKGTYSLRAIDPLSAYEETGQVKIDNTIVLRSSADHAKIVARVFSEGKPQDPAKITQTELAKFIAMWWWVGFATFPRIVYEAALLFFQRGLHVWYRPEVNLSSVGRTYTSEEKVLEGYFQAFLQHAVTEASEPLRVSYEAVHSGQTEVVWYSPSFTREQDRTLTIKVLSPAFYSRFMHYIDANEAFERECLTPEEKNCTAALHNPELLPVLIKAMRETSQPTDKRRRFNILESARWAVMTRLRCPPAAISYPSSNEKPSIKMTHRTSELDSFVAKSGDDAHVYRRVAIKLFLSERLALGFPPLLQMLDWLLRIAFLLASMIYCDNSNYVDVLRPRVIDREDATTIVTTLMLANAVHLWSLFKG